MGDSTGTEATPGLVETSLGPDGKPVFAGLVVDPPQMTTQANFDQWYRDVDGVNHHFEIELPLTPEGQEYYYYAYTQAYSADAK